MSTISPKQALIYGINELNKAKIDSARLDAELLISFLLGYTLEKLISNIQYPISNIQFNKYKQLIEKRAKYYPVAYLVGKKEFYGIEFYVNKNVLVPRPETELIVENVIDYCRGAIHCAQKKGVINHAPTILEIGTGSGCVALTLAKYLPKTKITAVDISEKALIVARKNRTLIQTRDRVSLQNTRFKQSNLLSNIGFRPDIIVANLPYLDNLKEILKESESKALKHEPQIALKGGRDGLDIYRKMFRQIKTKKWTGLTVFIEIGETQAKTIKKYIRALFPNAQIETKKDLANKDRVVIVKT